VSGPTSPGPGLPEGLTRETFPRFAEPHRQELKLHCYRMLGSLQDAEDAVQETFIRAWNALHEFEGRAAFKHWLYRIATNACLNALTSRSRRARLLPQHVTGPSSEFPRGQPDADAPWLQPYPDFELDHIVDSNTGPERRYEMREAVRLAFIAAIQQLPPRQRAALLLSDVIGWSPQEIASLLGGSVTSVNSVLQRARRTMQSNYNPDASSPGPAQDPKHRALLESYLRAWESSDLDAFVNLLKEDATYSMPPWRQWYHGRDAIRWFLGNAWKSYRGFRLLPAQANDQPAFGLYTLTAEPAVWQAHSLQVLGLHHDQISTLTLFVKPLAATLFPAFRLPLTLEQNNSSAP
jgi:RNA polymerase sigma-70 factor, ECF subfamily